MKLVIAEKPSVAMALAKVVGARERKDGYVEGKEYLVLWCVGHLIALCDASEYDERYKKWRYEDLPIIPEEWKRKVLDGTKKQFQILKKLMNSKEVDEVICATDAGREGELIFRFVYEQAGSKKPVKRLWISSMEERAIKEGFASLKDGSCYEDLYQSALCRAKADWLVGINASRLFSVLYNQNLKVGRVQTPTLAMIVERNQKVKEFVKEKYYVAHLTFGEFDAVSGHFQKKEEADKVASDCSERMCQVEKEDIQTKTVRSPKLYDLTSLQRDANRIFGYTAQQTLDAVQEMYEKKLVTYPRTDSQYLTDEMGESTRKLIQVLLSRMPFAEGIAYEPEVSKVLNSKKVSDHHAIIPTSEVEKADLQKLKEKERNILYLISARVLTATADPYIYETHKCQLTCNFHTFYFNARKTKQEGFQAIEKKLKQFLGVREPEQEAEFDLYLGRNIGPCSTSVSENFTQPPRQYTEDTLLAAMERAGNEDLTEDTEKKGLGTPATRAGIIEKLIQSGFVKREKKNLVPTDAGNVLVTFQAIEKKLKQFLGVREPEQEAEFDLYLGRNIGPCSTSVSENFTQPPRQYTEDTLLAAMERAGNEDLTEDTEKKGLGTPATRAGIIEKLIQSGFVKREKKNLVPTDAGNVLVTVLPDEIKSPKMTAEWEMALNHIAQGTETAEHFLSGITDMLGELISRYHSISGEESSRFPGTARGEVIGKCPVCGSDVREGKKNYYCTGQECRFSLWKDDRFLASQGKKMDKATAKKFLKKGKVHYKDLVSKRTLFFVEG